MNARPRRRSALAATLALLTALALAPLATRAEQESGDVQVTANVANSFLTLTLCDTTADFGAGLDSRGTAPTRSSGDGDAVAATSAGTDPGQGVYYRWTPSCQASGTGSFITVESSDTWFLLYCATENAGPGASPSLTVAQGDLRFTREPLPTYLENQSTFPHFAFPDCAGGVAGYGHAFTTNDTHFSGDFYYFLRVDDADENGAFASTTTWLVCQSAC